MNTIVLLTSRRSRTTSSCMSRRISGSSAENGSSNSRIVGIGGQRAGEADALLHAARQLVRASSSPMPPSPTSSSISLGLARAAATLSTPCTSRPKATLSTHACGAAAARSAGTPSTPCGGARRATCSRSAAVTSTPSIVTVPDGRLDQPGEAAHQRRLAAARQPHHDEHLARGDVEVDVAHRHDVAGARLEHLARQVGELGSDDTLGSRPVDLPQVAHRDHRLWQRSHPRPTSIEATSNRQTVPGSLAGARSQAPFGSLAPRCGYGLPPCRGYLERARVVIIGGGILGCCIAYHLTAYGETDVVLLEQHQLTDGATWHAAGLVGQLRSSRNTTRMLEHSVEMYRGLEAETGQAVDWHQVGSLRLSCSPERVDGAEAADDDGEVLRAADGDHQRPSEPRSCSR